MRSKSHFRGQYRTTKPQIPVLIKPYVRPIEEPKYHVPQENRTQKNPKSSHSSQLLEPLAPHGPSSSTNLSNSQNLQIVNSISPQESIFSSDEIDDMLAKTNENNLWSSIEKYFTTKLNLSRCILFKVLPNHSLFYSPTQKCSIPFHVSIINKSYSSRMILKTNTPLQHPEYTAKYDNDLIPDNCPLIIVPLLSNSSSTLNNGSNNICALIQCQRNPIDPHFTAQEDQFINAFSAKFALFSKWIFPANPIAPELIDLVHVQPPREELFTSILQRLKETYHSKIVEVWHSDRDSNTYSYISSQNSNLQFTETPLNKIGLVSNVLDNLQVVNTIQPSTIGRYNAEIDGDEPILAIPSQLPDDSSTYAIVLKREKGLFFESSEEKRLQEDTKLLSAILANSRIVSDLRNSAQSSSGLGQLLEIAESLSSQLDTTKLIPTIMEKGRELTKADRCSLFLTNKKGDRLVTSFSKGVSGSIELSIEKGIAGKTFTDKKILCIEDAYSNPSFDPTTDRETGYKTKSILSLPIFNRTGTECIGVTEMVNKRDAAQSDENNQKKKTGFTQADIQFMQIFNVFVGISLENARLFQENGEFSQKLQNLFDTTFEISSGEDVQKMLTQVIVNARKSCVAQAATLFLIDEENKIFKPTVVDGRLNLSNQALTTGLLGECYKTQKAIISNDVQNDNRYNSEFDQNDNDFKTISTIICPVWSRDKSAIIGLVEMSNKKEGFSQKELKLIQSFASFATVAIESSKIREVPCMSEKDPMETEVEQYITKEERLLEGKCPVQLVLTPEEQKEGESLFYYSIDWKGIKHVKLLFFIYNKFKLLETFHISNEMFYKFIYKLRSTYNDVPYHNWMHACDVMQYVAYEIFAADLNEVYTAKEIFTLFIATISHDANHSGFNNVYNVKAETPLGILFKNQSVMETHHCEMMIQILTQKEFNLLHYMDELEQKKFWNLAIELILATDMANHFNLVKGATEQVENKTFDLNKDEVRLLSMQLILKIGDISNVSRPFEIADKWCDVLNKEFYRQGDLEKSSGIGLTSPLNDREHPDKPKSQIGFYNFICLPLYSVVAKIFPGLQVNADSVKSNLESWKEIMNSPK